MMALKSATAIVIALWWFSPSVVLGTNCSISGATYGYPASTDEHNGVALWAPIVGVACANSGTSKCFDENSAWSEIAWTHGNKAVGSEEECHALCQEMLGCDVYTFWENGIDNQGKGPLCDGCPLAKGGTLLRDKGYCDNNGNCGICGETYDFFATVGVPSDAPYTCTDVQNYLQNTVSCCVYSSEAREAYRPPGACQLLTNAVPNGRVLGFFLDNDGTVSTGPKDCETTKWLPFLESTVGPPQPEQEEPIDFEEEGFCNVCPEAYGFELYAAKLIYDEGSNRFNRCDDIALYWRFNDLSTACRDKADIFLQVGCCSLVVVPEPTAAPTTDTLPRASDGRLCWVDAHSYGVTEDGACEDADIILVYASNATIALGETQGWWTTPNSSNPIPVVSTSPFNALDCHTACADTAGCGGWQLQAGACILKSRIDCSYTIARASLAATVAGVNGCVDASSTDSIEQRALNTSTLWYLDCDLPRCTAVHSQGTWNGDTLIPDFLATGDACWYKQFAPNELYDGCVQDRWIVINGGSNVLSFYAQMVNLFAPIQNGGSSSPLVGFELMIRYSVIDVVLRAGSLPVEDANGGGLLYMNSKRFCEIDPRLPCEEGSLSFQGGNPNWDERYWMALESVFADAPYEPGATRITFVAGQIWNNAEAVLRALGGGGSTNGWENTKVVFYGQAMVWYPCNIERWCSSPELGSTNEEMFAKYRSDLEQLMDVGRTTCGTERYECFFATHAYGGSLGGRPQTMIAILQEITSLYNWAHFVDYNGFVLAEEIVDGHVTPAMILPVQQMIWNVVCDDAPTTGCPEAITRSASCSRNCETCTYCSDRSWACMNERQCNYDKLDPVPWSLVSSAPLYLQGNENTSDSLSVACFDASALGDLYIPPPISAPASAPASVNSCPYRIWCGSKGEGWIVGVCLFLVGVTMILGGACYVGKKKKKNAADEKASTDKIEEPLPSFSSSELVKTAEMSVVEKEFLEKATDAESPSKEPPETATVVATPSPKEHLDSLGMARLIASQHIVVGHLFAEGATANVYFFGWGFTWVPWFFMLSGYVLTHARLNSSNPTRVDGPYKHIAKRLSTIFPVYAYGVFLAMIIRVARDVRLPGIDVLIAQSYLVQSWVPTLTEHALVSQCWFLSDLVIYWAMFGIVYRWLRTLTLRWTCAILAFICVLPWLIVIVPALDKNIEATWYKAHRWGQTDEPHDIWTVMLKFHPIFYIHVFLFGMLLAVLRHHLKAITQDTTVTTMMKYISHFGATIGYIGLVLVFSIEDIQPSAHRLSARLSVLLPLQGLILLGLSPLPQVVAERGLKDPLAILFAYAPSWAGDVSYCQYVLQFAMWALFPMRNVDNPSFFLYLWGASMVTYKLIQEPSAKLWRSLLPKKDEPAPIKFLPSLRLASILLVPPTVLAVIVGIAKAAYDPAPRRSSFSVAASSGVGGNTTNATNATNFTALPPFVRVGPEAVDLKLNWTLANETSSGEMMTQGVMPINPTMLFRDDGNGGLQWIRAVRAHAVTEVFTNGMFESVVVTEQILRFHSAIMLSSEPFLGDLDAGFNDAEIEKWGLDSVVPLESVRSSLLSHVGKGTYWDNLCEPYPSFDASTRWLVRKQVNGPEDPKLLEIPELSVAGNSPGWGVTFSSFPPAAVITQSSLPADCMWAPDAVMQMYLAFNGPALAKKKNATGVRLKCASQNENEKNWIAFSHEGHLYYIYSVQPHVVVHVRPTDGACVEQYKTSNPMLKDVGRRVFAIRGSATAVPFTEGEYLALLHTFSPGSGYVTAAYAFANEPPFAVTRVSRPLPLHSRAFPSSLVVRSDKVLIGYGENDQTSRVLVMSRNHLERQFDWCA